MRKREITVGVISIVAALVAGVAATILPSLLFKWTIAVTLAIAFVLFLLIARDAERVLLFTLVLIIPFSIGTGLPPLASRLGHIGLSHEFDVQLIDVVIFSLIIYRFIRLATHQDKIRLFPFTTIPALAWIITSTLSMANAREMDVAMIQVGLMIKLFLLYISVANSIKNETDIKWIVTALFLGVFLEGLVGVYQWAAGGPLGLEFLGEPTQFNPDRALGTIGHPNGYAMYLAATMPLGLALLFMDVQGVYKGGVGAVLGFGLLGLLFSLSRGGWLGFVGATLVVLVFAIRRRRQNLQIAFVGASLILVGLFLVTYSLRDLIASRLSSTEASDSARIRGTLNVGAIAMIKAHPFIGIGLNNYGLFMPEYDPIAYLAERRPVIVHNVFLLIIAETGFVGAFSFLWFLMRLFINALRLISLALNETFWLVGVGAFSAYTALVIHGMADYNLVASMPIFRLMWLFAAIVAGLSEIIKAERATLGNSMLHGSSINRSP